MKRKSLLRILILTGLAPLVAVAPSVQASSLQTSKTIQLPRDAAMHPSAHTEWWYVVGHLKAGRKRFGFETTLFKLRHVQIPGSKSVVSVDRADVALTDVSNHGYLHSVTYAEPPLTPVRLSTSKLDERIASARVWSNGKRIKLHSSVGSARLRLLMKSRRRALLEGGTGLVPMGKGGSSYYYSLTDLKVGGTVRYHGKILAVTGIAWMDHQWGSWNWNGIHGWTWGGIQLANGADLSIADFHTSGASLRGSSISYPGGKQTTVRSIRISATGHWRSPHDHLSYPSGWTVRIPRIKAVLSISPLVKNQEMYDSTIPQASYWEGDCSVTGRVGGVKVTGQAYMELVGVGGRFL